MGRTGKTPLSSPVPQLSDDCVAFADGLSVSSVGRVLIGSAYARVFLRALWPSVLPSPIWIPTISLNTPVVF